MTIGIRGKLVGIVLIVVGAWPFLLRADRISELVSRYDFLEYLVPGELFYQIVLILLGVLLLWRVRVVAEPVEYNSRRRRR